jgi:hypothetical protein
MLFLINHKNLKFRQNLQNNFGRKTVPIYTTWNSLPEQLIIGKKSGVREIFFG